MDVDQCVSWNGNQVYGNYAGCSASDQRKKNGYIGGPMYYLSAKSGVPFFGFVLVGKFWRWKYRTIQHGFLRHARTASEPYVVARIL